jgi:hypothetical protein
MAVDINVVNKVFSKFIEKGIQPESFEPTQEFLDDITSKYDIQLFLVDYIFGPDSHHSKPYQIRLEQHSVNYDPDKVTILYDVEKCKVLDVSDEVVQSNIRMILGFPKWLKDNNADVKDRFYMVKSESQIIIFAYARDIVMMEYDFIWHFVAK